MAKSEVKEMAWEPKSKLDKQLRRALAWFQNDEVSLLGRHKGFDKLDLGKKGDAKSVDGALKQDVKAWLSKDKKVELYEGTIEVEKDGKKDDMKVIIAVVSAKKGTAAAFGDFILYDKKGERKAELLNQPLWDDSGV